MNLNCPDCGHVAALEPSQLNSDGSYFGRCRNCNRRLIKQAVAVEPACEVERAELPYFLKSEDEYQNWRKEIYETVEEIKRVMYPVCYKYADIYSPGSPPKKARKLKNYLSFLLAPVASQIFRDSMIRAYYKGSFLRPPILLRPHRVLLEARLKILTEFQRTPASEIRILLEDDLRTIRMALGWLEKAKAKLRDKFPDLPMEYDKDPCPRDDDFLVFYIFFAPCLSSALLGVVLPIWLGKRSFEHITFIFTWLAAKMFPALFESLSKYDLMHPACILALFIYLSMGMAVYRYCRPTMGMKYPHSFSFIYRWPYHLASASGVLFFMYLFPEAMTDFFYKLNGGMSYAIFSVLLPFTLGSCLGSVAFALRKHLTRAENSAYTSGR